MAIIVALSLVVLVGLVGLVVDTGKLYIAKTQAQTSADACALAAAQALGGANPLAVSEAAGIRTGTDQGNRILGVDVVLAVNDSVRFSTTLNGTYVTKDSAVPTAGFVRCNVERTQIPTWLIQVMNIIPGGNIQPNTVRATAVAARVAAQTNCALPVAICSTAAPTGLAPGTWLQGVIGPSGGQNNGQGGLTGNFKWVDFTPPAGGASELAQMLSGPGTCNLPAVGTQVGQPGAIGSAANDWNSRFGIYQGSVRPDNAVPDFTGYAYTEVNWPSKFNAYGDFRNRRASNAPYQGDAATGLNTNGTISGSAFLAANGADRRLAAAPVVDCAGFTGGSSTAPVLRWICVLMLHPLNKGSGGSGTGANRMYLEYRGNSSDDGSPCASLGVPGEGGVSQGPQVPALFQ